MGRVLVLDDDETARNALTEFVRAEGFEAESCARLAEARKVIERRHFDLVLMDLQLPDGNGMELLPALLESRGTEVVVITGHATVDTAVDALRYGAVDYLTKPIDRTRLDVVLAKAAATASLRREVDELRNELRRMGRFGLLIGNSKVMQQVYDLITKVAPTDATVLVSGPTGSGKEPTARMIHRLSRRAAKDFVPINCAAVSSGLIESELFGHEKGSFTGADNLHRGVFERANGGTLFLDEVTEMPLEVQVKLLRVIETSTFSRVGAEEQREVDVRMIAATNSEPKRAVADGKLREDLLYRLNVFPITLPPLHARGDDVELLARHFLEHLNQRAERNKKFTDPAIVSMKKRKWPGNVRELRNAVERAFILASGDEVEASHFPFADASKGSAHAQGLEISPGMSIKEAERLLTLATMEKVGGVRRAAAEMLGISEKTLYNRLREYDYRKD